MAIIESEAARTIARTALDSSTKSATRPILFTHVNKGRPPARQHVVLATVYPGHSPSKVTPPRFRPRDTHGRFVPYAEFGASLVAGTLDVDVELVPDERDDDTPVDRQRIASMRVDPSYLTLSRLPAIDCQSGFLALVDNPINPQGQCVLTVVDHNTSMNSPGGTRDL